MIVWRNPDRQLTPPDPQTPRNAVDQTKPMTWRAKAACRGVEPGIFFPVTDEEADDAKAICSVCSVRQACLDWALATREHDGVWGGATERERRRMLRQRRRSA